MSGRTGWPADEGSKTMDDDFDCEPDLDFGYEFDSAMTSAGWGTDEDYGLIGGDSDLWGES